MIVGQSAQATCHISEGDLPLKIRWTHRGKHLKSHQTSGIFINNVGRRDSFLVIDPVYPIDSGNYTCSATNIAGTIERTALLMVQGIFLFFNNICVPHLHSNSFGLA